MTREDKLFFPVIFLFLNVSDLLEIRFFEFIFQNFLPGSFDLDIHAMLKFDGRK